MIIGRDKLLENEIFPRLEKGQSFILIGQRGIGKSKILKWAYEHCPDEKKVLVNAGETLGDIIKAMCQVNGIVVSKKKIGELEKEVIQGERVTVFLDDAHKLTPKQAQFFTNYNELYPVYLSGIEPFREEIKRLTWGKKKLVIHAVAKEYREELARHVISETGANCGLSTLINGGKGVPARTWAIGKGEFIRDDDERVEGEEINIAPILMIGVGGIMIMRYLAIGMEQKDLYILGGCFMGFAYFLRIMIMGMSKKWIKEN